VNFRKKLKTRLYTGIAYIILGIAMTAVSIICKIENQFISSLGLALAVIGIVRIRNYFIITKDDESVRRREIAETDERNVSIANKARGAAFILYIFIVSLFVIVMGIIDKSEIALWASYSVALLVAIYWICYIVYQKKS
jgi:VIT1/CCC1 family predicted Fe2+/Mn2+ transporter